MRTELEPEAARIPRFIAAVSGVAFRYPCTVLLLTALSCGLAIWYTAVHLTYQVHRNDLIGKNRDYYRRWDQYVREFGDDDDMVVVVQGADRAAMIAALEELAGEIQQRPELFDRLFYKADLRKLRNRALLFLPTDQIRHIQEELSSPGLSGLLNPPVLAQVDPMFTWRSLTVAQLAGRRPAQGAALERGGRQSRRRDVLPPACRHLPNRGRAPGRCRQLHQPVAQHPARVAQHADRHAGQTAVLLLRRRGGGVAVGSAGQGTG